MVGSNLYHAAFVFFVAVKQGIQSAKTTAILFWLLWLAVPGWRGCLPNTNDRSRTNISTRRGSPIF